MVRTALFPIIGGLGVLLALIGLGLSVFSFGPAWAITLCESLALMCLLTYFVMNWQRLKVFSTRRTTRMGANSVMAVLLCAGILGILNFLAIRHGNRWDFSESRRFTLAPQTYQVLGELAQPVRVSVFSHERSPGYAAYRDLIEAYSRITPNVKAEFIDPERSPDRAREFGITQMDTAVFQSGTQTIHITRASEQELTNAFIRVTKVEKKRIGFLMGHGEPSFGDRSRNGFSLVKDHLEKQGYEVVELFDLTDSRPLMKLAVVVVAGPQKPVARQEIEVIAEYVRQKGRILVLIDPQTTHGLDMLLTQWGVNLGPGIIVDPEDRLSQANPTALRVKTFTDHEITHNLTMPVVLPVTRRIQFNPEHAPGWTFMPLAHSSDKSWIEMNLNNPSPVRELDTDIPGPLVLAGALERRQEDATPSAGTPAVVIIGNSTFATNAYLGFPGNTDFFLQTIAWLAGEQELLSITPKDPALRPFIPNPAQEHMLLALQVFSVPSLLLLAGLTIWRRRSRL